MPTRRRMHPDDQPVTTDVLAGLIATLPGVADQLLADHVNDGRGYCKGCALPQAGLARWPCTLHAVAKAARDRVILEVALAVPTARPGHGGAVWRRP